MDLHVRMVITSVAHCFHEVAVAKLWTFFERSEEQIPIFDHSLSGEASISTATALARRAWARRSAGMPQRALNP